EQNQDNTNSSESTTPVTFKTYTNPQLNFSTSIPDDWIMSIADNDIRFNSKENEDTLKQIKSGKMYGEGFSYDVTFHKVKNLSELTYPLGPEVEKSAKTLPDYFKADNTIKWDGKTDKINGLTAYNIGQGGFGYNELEYYQAPSGAIYQIFFGNPDVTPKPIKDKIIQSFKLLK
ncbi:MAG TPA: PsbP-related protein, partial [Patescibacteria group bacterium]|nr:PsbP-related protein [Patescibacteria group bacterium]